MTAPAKLIFIEGLPGTGKSSTTQHIWRQFRMHGVDANWYHESHGRHPLRHYGGDANHLERLVRRIAKGVGRRDLDLAVERRIHRRKWERFARQIHANSTTCLIDAMPLQYPLLGLLWRDVDQGLIKAHVRTLIERVRLLVPSLIFLAPRNIKRLMRRMIDVRGDDFGRWLVDETTRGAYARSRNLTGFDGMLQFWEDYVAICKDLLADWPGPRIDLTTATNRANWHQVHERILGFLEVPITEKSTRSSDWHKLAGVYESGERVCVIDLEGDELTIQEQTIQEHAMHGAQRENATRIPPRLIPFGERTYDVASLPYVVQFSTDDRSELTIFASGPGAAAR